MKIAYCLLCRGRHQEFVYSVRTHAPFVDKSIIILHGDASENSQNMEYLSSDEARQWDIDVIRTNIPYEPKALRDLYMEKLDVYMEEVGEQVWFVIMDSDEYLELPALYSLRKLAVEAEKRGVNILGFNSHDIQTAPDGQVHENKSGYWNPNFNKHYPGMRYTPGTHIGIARPVPAQMANVPLRYFHVKTQGSQWLRGCRNYWTTAEVAQNTTSSPVWKEFKELCSRLGYVEFDSIWADLQTGTIHEDLTRWFILNRNSDNSEARSWFVVYFVYLHPELNIGCAGNRDYVYDKSRTPATDMSF